MNKIKSVSTYKSNIRYAETYLIHDISLLLWIEKEWLMMYDDQIFLIVL